MILGIDVSRWDLNIKWDILKTSGIEFAFCKATQGNYLTDPTLKGNMDGAAKAGMVVGAYHWCDPTVSASRQADYFLDAISEVKYHFLAVDMEQYWADWNEWRKKDINNILSGKQISENARVIVNEIKKRSPVPIIVYTSPWFVDEYARPSVDWLKDTPLWLAHYPFKSGRVKTTWEDMKVKYKPTVLTPRLPSGIKTWNFWQFTGDKFVLPGCDSAIDINYFNGELNDLRKMVGIKVEDSEQRPNPDQPTKPLTADEKIANLEKKVQKLEEEAIKHGWII